jgi:hypothetical protein
MIRKTILSGARRNSDGVEDSLALYKIVLVNRREMRHDAADASCK